MSKEAIAFRLLQVHQQNALSRAFKKAALQLSGGVLRTPIIVMKTRFSITLCFIARFCGLAVVLAGYATATDAQATATDSAAPVASDSLFRLLDRFLADPTRNGRRWREILDSAEASPHVAITLTPGVVPWICGAVEKSSAERALRSILTGAFVAGNMREQLVRREKGDQPLAGVLAALDSYEKIRARVLNFRLAELDRWAELQAAGTLAAHVAALAANPPQDCATAVPPSR